MVRTSLDSPKRHMNDFFVRIVAVFAPLAKGAHWLKPKPKDKDGKIDLRMPLPTSLLAKPKKLLSNISSKALLFAHNKKKQSEEAESEVEEWGDGSVWQKEILMEDKCQPLDFSGAIYYDSQGKQMSAIPLRSPHANPLPGYLTRLREQNLNETHI